MNEADTCRNYVVPKLGEAGWDDAPHSINEQRSFTDGRIIPLGNKVRRGSPRTFAAGEVGGRYSGKGAADYGDYGGDQGGVGSASEMNAPR